MTIEDGLDEEIFVSGNMSDLTRERETQRRKNQDIAASFLGKGQYSVESLSVKWYSGKLLAVTVKSIISSSGGKLVSTRGYSGKEAFYHDVQIDYSKYECCVVDGQLLVENGADRFIITICTGNGNGHFVQVCALEKHKEKNEQIIKDITDYMAKNNFYKGKKLKLGEDISFLDTGERNWDSVILDPDMKKLIRRNTIGILKRCGQLPDFGIALRRGIILSGDPGTGKTAVCKALMSEANDITCIITDAYGMFSGRYIPDLFAIAQLLSPTIIFIEDLDSIAHERKDYFHGDPPLISLLAEMDGIEVKAAIVTVATTNNLETMDKALSERPSRFDRVFKISRPDCIRRIEMLRYLSSKIPLSECMMEYIARKTEGFTPAQLQEVPTGMVINQLDELGKVTEFSRQDVDTVISQMNNKKQSQGIGFNREL